LYDTISMLEKMGGEAEGAGAGAASVLTDAMKKAAGKRGPNQAQLAAMELMMASMFGGSSLPTLRSIIGRRALKSVRPSSNVREAAVLMNDTRNAVLVIDAEGDVAGILTPRDVLNRVIAKSKSPDLTAVSSVMTPNPDCVSPDLTLLDALREMHDQKCFHLPVREEEDGGRVLGVVDVMELVSSTAGDGADNKGWRDFFASVGDREGDDDSAESSLRFSAAYNSGMVMGPSREGQSDDGYDDTCSDVFSLSLANIAASQRSGTNPNRRSMAGSSRQSAAGMPTLSGGDEFSEEFVFKISDSNSHIHRIKCAVDNIDFLRTQIAEKVIPETANSTGADGDRVILKYIDDDSDEVILSDNASLMEAVDLARAQNLNSLKLSVTLASAPATDNGMPVAKSNDGSIDTDASKPAAASTQPTPSSEGGSSTMLILGLTGLLAIGGAAAFMLLKSKK